MTAKKILTKANLQNTYWGKIIILAEAGKSRFTLNQARKADDWCTCACGRLTHDIPRNLPTELTESWPLDEDLYSLGVKYNACIGDDRPIEAAKVLVAIEDRAQIVAAQHVTSAIGE